MLHKLALLILVFTGLNIYSQITSAEYYFDTEPGAGNATALAVTSGSTVNETHNIDVSSLSTGFHVLYLRTKNTDNVWALYDKNAFYISELFTTSLANISAAEYYFDTEPGVGNGTAIPVTAGGTINEVVNLDISSLATGFHSFYIRTKNIDNIWGIYDKNAFYISESFSGSTPEITAAEYYFDTEPGLGNGTAISVTPGGTINEVINLDITGLATGFHSFYIRTKNTDNVWSLYDKNVFYISESYSSTVSDITGAEYYFDTEPGLGNGMAATITSTGEPDEYMLEMDTSAYSCGDDINFYVRVQNEAGTWSLYDFRNTVMSSTPIITSDHEDLDLDAGDYCDTNLPDYTGDLVATDACETELTVVQTPESGTVISGGLNEVTLSVTNEAGYSSEVSFNIAVVDTSVPSISCVENQAINLNEGESVYTVVGTEFDPIATSDNCGVSSIENDFNSIASLDGEEFPIGTTTVIWFATDGSDNQAQCSYNVQVYAYIGLESYNQNKVTAYPNPTQNKMYLKLQNSSIKHVEIHDMNGKLLLSQTGLEENESIDLSNYESGVYHITVQTEKGVFTTKIIRE